MNICFIVAFCFFNLVDIKAQDPVSTQPAPSTPKFEKPDSYNIWWPDVTNMIKEFKDINISLFGEIFQAIFDLRSQPEEEDDDGREREFRGFATVEQSDTEHFDDFVNK